MEATRRTDSWFTSELLAPLAELNLHCLELVRARVRDGQPGALPYILSELAGSWSALGDGEIAAIAAFPYALVQTTVIDGVPSMTGGVHDRPRREAFFEPDQLAGLVREIVVLGWHVARTQRQVAQVVLGLDARCVELVASSALRDLPRVADTGAIDVRLRWSNRPAVWRHALGAALDGDEIALGRARLRGLQLLAAEAWPLAAA